MTSQQLQMLSLIAIFISSNTYLITSLLKQQISMSEHLEQLSFFHNKIQNVEGNATTFWNVNVRIWCTSKCESSLGLPGSAYTTPVNRFCWLKPFGVCHIIQTTLQNSKLSCWENLKLPEYKLRQIFENTERLTCVYGLLHCSRFF